MNRPSLNPHIRSYSLAKTQIEFSMPNISNRKSIQGKTSVNSELDSINRLQNSKLKQDKLSSKISARSRINGGILMTPQDSTNVKFSSTARIDPETKQLIFGRGSGFLQLTKISRLYNKDSAIENILSNKYKSSLNNSGEVDKFNQNELIEQFSHRVIKTARTQHEIETNILKKTLSKVKPQNFDQYLQDQAMKRLKISNTIQVNNAQYETNRHIRFEEDNDREIQPAPISPIKPQNEGVRFEGIDESPEISIGKISRLSLIKMRSSGPEDTRIISNQGYSSHHGDQSLNKHQLFTDKEYQKLMQDIGFQEPKSTSKLHDKFLKKEQITPKYQALVLFLKKLSKRMMSLKPLLDVSIQLITKTCLVNYDEIPNAIYTQMMGKDKSIYDDTTQNYTYFELYNASLDYLRHQKTEIDDVKHQHDHQINQLNVEMKIRDDMISRMEIDIQSLKEINSSSNSSLIKEKNLLLFKVEELKDEISQLRVKYNRSSEELNKTQKLLQYTQDDKDRFESKISHYKDKLSLLKEKMQSECIDNKNFVAIVDKYKSIIRNLERQLKEECREKTELQNQIQFIQFKQNS
eukprot:403349074